MSRAEDDEILSTSDDDLIEVQVTRSSSTTSGRRRNVTSFDNLLNPRAAQRSRLGINLERPPLPVGGTRRAGSNPRRTHPPAAVPQVVPPRPLQASSRRTSARNSQPDTPVIDLTEEPDSPLERRQTRTTQVPAQEQHNHVGRNPRRTNSQRISPPRLSRSDSTFMGPPRSFIDLTADSPEDERIHTREGWRLPSPLPPRHFRRRSHVPTDHLMHMQLFDQQALASELARGFGRTLAGFLNGQIIGNNFHSDVEAVFHHPREPSPKPPMEPVPPAKPGFTRDTCGDSKKERVAICPACNDELAYDPVGSLTSMSGAKKRKRASGEHHFWALKKCGHVYCAECFENRRPTKMTPNGVGFDSPTGRAPTNPNDIRCAVDGCDTKVATKTEWVGIFL